ncbi:DUF421 domain-containing protein [Halalkalibacter hemicellulosilyticus]|uniref:DUF421 domain-containing protein n=1 Tax=Halalkalibacter hemicellulosilyticusJCM 9152 TaxID=1236971 RepID=W4QAB9_9BACI|nr:DUF421 domain-containing protein [Halalkalibacter hemicellulosilyticus]GAE28945.1 hypothetical protein JCM9152_283 [Halalkalibacter hemicellulosilyticusJCM 9152]
MNTNFLSLTVELFVGFFALLVLTKILGKNQITQLTPFDFISALVLGELVGNAIYDKDIGLHYVIYAVFLWGALIYTIEMITQKFRGSRSILEGKPSFIIAKGKIQFSELKKNKLDFDQLLHLLRSQGVFSIREVEYGVLETNGSVSVLKKSQYSYPTQQDLNMPPTSVKFPVILILDGEVIQEGLDKLNKDSVWLKKELFQRGIAGTKQVVYAEWLEDEGFEIQTY